ncbi:MAG TPA: hypothetical protein VFU03_07425, partial [Gemmatimonadales bacterium]|nr:hypothetical protein [Gemmatimonadales bacterium]
PHVETAVLIALEKLPADRFASAAQFAEALQKPGATLASRTATQAVLPLKQLRWRRVAIGACAVALVALALAAWQWLRPKPVPPVIRYSMGLPEEQAIVPGTLGVNLALSPDGNRLVYVGPGPGGGQLWLRERDRLDATPMTGTSGGLSPFFSPDGRQIGFSSGATNELKTMPATGGPPVTIVTAGLGAGGGGAWSSDGWLYYDSPPGYSRIRATGGTPEVIVPLDSAHNEVGLAWPDVLPNARGLLLRSRRNLSPEDFTIIAVDLRSGERHVLGSGLLARYVAPGYILIVRSDGTLVAAPFDQDRLKLTGTPTPIVEGMMIKPFGSVDVAVSGSGTLVYAPGGANPGGVGEVIWLERNGGEESLDPQLVINPSVNYALALSPDGNRLALDVIGQRSVDIWVKQLPSGPFSRLTFEGGVNMRPSWTADGKSLIYLSDRSGRTTVWRQRADGSAPAEQIRVATTHDIREAALSRDGQWLVFRENGDSSADIYALRPGQDTLPIPLLTTRFNEVAAALSPDGKWLAYTSDESGQAEVYVRPFPNAGQGRWQVSIGGGNAARWSRSGHELFYQTNTNQMMVVTVGAGPTFNAGQPRKLFDPSSRLFPSVFVPYYDVGPDDKRFLSVRLAGSKAAPGGGRLVVVENWFRELRQKVEAARR